MANISATELVFGSNGYKCDRLEFVAESPGVAIPLLIVLVVASFVGTFGNVLILTSVARYHYLQNMESIFIVNLAISDMYVTAFADPWSIVAKLEGYRFFESAPNLCRTIASLCTMSCITSLGTITLLSFNRYVNICHYKYYHKIFKKHTCVMFCMSLYLVGLFLVLLNQADIGGHGFDHKSLECIWDRMATYSYTVVFSVVLVWIPITTIGFSYINVYRIVRESRARARTESVSGEQIVNNKTNQLFNSLIIIYGVFSACWIPYALIIVLDSRDTFPLTAHVYVTVWAHLHPSINWLVYYRTHRKFRKAFSSLLHLDRCLESRRGSPSSTSGTSIVSSCKVKDRAEPKTHLYGIAITDETLDEDGKHKETGL